MTQPASLSRLIISLWHRLSRRRQVQFVLILGLMVMASLAEVVSVGAILPFLGVLTAPERVFAHAWAQPFISLLGATKPEELLLPMTVVFAATVLAAGTTRLVLTYVTTRFSYAIGADFSMEVYRRTLYQPYSVHISRNSSEIINAIYGKTAMLTGSILMPMLSLFSVAILLFGLLLAFLALDPLITIAISVGFVIIYSVILQLTRHRLQRNSEVIAHESTRVIKSLQEGLGGIRDVLIDGSQATYCAIYQNADRPLRRAQGNNTFISASPRYVIETLGMILIAFLAYTMSQREGGLTTAVPVLGALALGAQRLLPVLQQAYSALTIIRGAEASLRDTIVLFEQPLPEDAGGLLPRPLPFDTEIVLKNVSFSYTHTAKPVLQHIDLVLARGKRIGFMGVTGGGKSTLLDIIMGLLRPTEGSLLIDGQAITEQNYRSWQVHVAHVPQSIYLSDSSIEENIAFGLPKEDIDPSRLRLAAKQAQIDKVIESWPEKYQTKVGERGVRLSGGQRQRIGIARALYKRADVIIFDEATSALDSETEHSVMQAINSLSPDLTILIVAHRLTTLENCDFIVELDKGRILQIGSYKELVNRTRA
jgi:ABC-type multidrug transport system fused ATPase/permease subunit